MRKWPPHLSSWSRSIMPESGHTLQTQGVMSTDKLSMCVQSPFISNESPEKPIEIKDSGNMWHTGKKLLEHWNIETCEKLPSSWKLQEWLRAVGLRSMASRWCSISFREAWLSISFQSFWSFQCEPSKPWGLEDAPCWTPAGATHWSMLELEIESKSSKTRSEERPTSLHGHPWIIPISRPPTNSSPSLPSMIHFSSTRSKMGFSTWKLGGILGRNATGITLEIKTRNR